MHGFSPASGPTSSAAVLTYKPWSPAIQTANTKYYVSAQKYSLTVNIIIFVPVFIQNLVFTFESNQYGV